MGAADLQYLLWLVGIATCVKVLLVPAYHSTDFEVHRHWLAITHSLPLKEWYSDESSQWTLDYPPFFAFFERFLAIFASWFDPQIVDLVNGQNYAVRSVVLFQRGTVMAADLVLYWGLWEIGSGLSRMRRRILYLVVIFSPGLLIVDHIHFQYNGFLFGILFLSLAAMRDGNDLLGGIYFAALVCFKHLFAIAGPIYFVYILRHYCKGPQKIARFCIMASAVISIVALAFGPFLYHGQMPQLMKRLFPFGRGLCHAYWAPNVWALYSTGDKSATVVMRKLFGVYIDRPKAGLTGGLVGDFTPYAVFPQITPIVSAILVIGSMMPCLVQAWRKPVPNAFIRWVVYTFTCGFMFGWHVHEKASLHMVIPFSVLAVERLEDARAFLFLSVVSTYSLFPLLFESKEYPIKVTLLLLYALVIWLNFSQLFGTSTKDSGDLKAKAASNTELNVQETVKPLIGPVEGAYLGGIMVIEIYGQCFHPLFFGGSFPFVPLMLTSVYCALGMTYYWLDQLHMVLSS
ncbi:dolichyl pyrophosphate Glc1Man9GlcNAc2 alpha-1,3-glucosyltransferase-like [Physcomitrium patens]|uniref:Alpha-1,3-glucosyltransferase n=1 Tax=Physcomitrium patens TaxID=3218 RepID=A9RXF0_PHYPA|nr:probable dolichyl pyrophosphate Glc1Man9GlcNAc2 alpha-1,3-glucosyltransferase [Physcomitrium patens]PNR41342.1 hypothetical protein PHYPA_018745 [Physcomitrium patens]|eukprot:XP_024395635.1 probable dolichyl pyrophosphate Glc1Man9GlcNAc2 alpha-1,3-glucosyltransferase [Physcomitrella patens]